MKAFGSRELGAALAHAAGGGQALHLHRVIADRGKAPRCFVADVGRGLRIGHLFDRDGARLVATARRLGVRAIRIDREGTDRQHIDLCAGPLRKALAMCEAGRESPAG